MEILINRFTLRHNGANYLPGDVLEIDDTEGEILIERSKGAIIKVKRKKTIKQPKRKIEIEDEMPDIPPDINDEDEDDTEEDETPEQISLPTADPAKAVSTTKGKGK